MAPPEPKTGIEREIDLLWKQGINVLREQVKGVEQSVKDLAENVASARRWAVGLIIVAIPAYAMAFYTFFMRR